MLESALENILLQYLAPYVDGITRDRRWGARTSSVFLLCFKEHVDATVVCFLPSLDDSKAETFYRCCMMLPLKKSCTLRWGMLMNAVQHFVVCIRIHLQVLVGPSADHVVLPCFAHEGFCSKFEGLLADGSPGPDCF